ncbi:tandem-95 repeat protein [Rhodopirellula europaea]|uniref:Peptidase domain protein n=1 Tax=Rhodopirellula europaea SH398 TaxID=1263868 RepID=M5SCN0_9BACT|nr:Ig-like domain-containing protein [Rhodopirellula europaea]EMI29260.1 peptidase domain protein [Rhodopirellula europaea SH398]
MTLRRFHSLLGTAASDASSVSDRGTKGQRSGKSRRTRSDRRSKWQTADRRLNHETLEKRELLAAELGLIAHPVFAPGTPSETIEQWHEEHGDNHAAITSGTKLPGFQFGPQLQPILFNPTDPLRWRTSALNPSGAPNLGDPITLTWSIVPDGTPMLDPNTGNTTGTSNLVGFLDSVYGSGATNEITEKPWFGIFSNVYDVWSVGTGLSFVYEDDDDMAPWAADASIGEADVRADLRIAGAAIDGDYNVLAANYPPSGFGSIGLDGDMIIDTTDRYYSDTANSAFDLNIELTNILSHEIGHGLGLGHVMPTNGTKLMEPFISANYYGPQEDDVFNINMLYGDAMEPNDTMANAVNLGVLDLAAQTITDVSIDSPNTDVDVFAFSLSHPTEIDLIVTPVGSAYFEGEQGGAAPVEVDRQRQQDLQFRLLDGSGNQISLSNDNTLGNAEFRAKVQLAEGSYFVEVSAFSGTDSQAYRMSVGNSARVIVGPTLLAIRPDDSGLLQDGDTLEAAPNEFNLFFNGGADLDEATISSDTVKLIRAGEDGIFGPNPDNLDASGNPIDDDIQVELGYVGLLESGSIEASNLQQIVMRPASNAAQNAFDPSFGFPDDLYKIVLIGEGNSPLQSRAGVPFDGGNNFETTFRLNRGAQVVAVVPQPVVRANATQANPEGTLSQQSDTIVIHFDGQLLDIGDAENPAFYRLIDTRATADKTDDQLAPLQPNLATYDVAEGTVTLQFSGPIPEGNYRLDIGEAGTPVGGSPTVPSTSLTNNDNNSTLLTASDLTGTPASPVTLDATGVRIASQIQVQSVPLAQRVGGSDEPGHREIQREPHVRNDEGTNLIAPSSIEIVRYYFPDTLGTDANGQDYINLITEKEKEIVRTLFDIFAGLSGYEFVETSETVPGLDELMIGKGDFRAVSPSLGPNDGVAGLANSTFAILNGTLFNQSNRFFGDGFTETMMHEIAHSLGLGHSYDIPSLQGAPLPNDVLPGDHDIVQLQRVSPPNATDIDLYKFAVAEGGRFTAETFAERLSTPSGLSTVLTLFGINDDGSMDIIARNDRYFGNDSFLDVDLEAGTYLIGVSSTDNEDYNPLVPDSGFGGTTDGQYELELKFAGESASVLRDVDGTPIDGDRDGTPGGVFSFYFQASDVSTTVFVDRLNDPNAAALDGDGTLGNAFDNIGQALQRAGERIVFPTVGLDALDASDTFEIIRTVNGTPETESFHFGAGGITLATSGSPEDAAVATASAINAVLPGSANVVGRTVELTGIERLDLSGSDTLLNTPNLVRIIGNDADGDPSTTADIKPYLIGTATSGASLRDGAEFRVPQGVTAMIDAGALLKMRKSNLDVGSSSIDIDRSAAALQVLGTPDVPVWLRSYFDSTFGGNSTGSSAVNPPSAGDFGGIVLRDDSDLESSGMFLNYISHTDIRHGGGKVFVDSAEDSFSPIHVIDSRPSIAFNRITDSNSAAVSASPDSFDESGGRIGPEIVGNYLANNTINGLFIRIETQDGQVVTKLTTPGRFNDTDIAHVLTENLVIAGNVGGRYLDKTTGELSGRASGRLLVDPGIVIKSAGARIEAEAGGSAIIAEGTKNRPVIFTSINDDRYGSSGVYDTTNTPGSAGLPGDWGGFYFGFTSSGSIDNAIISYGGGDSSIEGGSANFNVIEIHQAEVRITNSLISDNANGNASGVRNGRGANASATIYVRGSQPIIVGNEIVDNEGPAININANSLQFTNTPDYGRSTGRLEVFSEFDDNVGPLVRLNQFENNGINGMLVRGEVLTTESIWDDTDIVHVLQNEIVVGNHHSNSGLTLRSSGSESLVVKLQGNNAGFTATGSPAEIVDRIGGTVTVSGSPGFPVILTSLQDDSVGAGFTPTGAFLFDTGNDGQTGGQKGDWRGLSFDEFSNDRNVAVVRERETPLTAGKDENSFPGVAQFVGTLAPDQKSGDENRRLGFEVQGFISPDSPEDLDVYSFEGTAGTPVWLDIDRTDSSLDTVIEVLNANGTVVARSMSSFDPNEAGSLNNLPLIQNPLLGGDFNSENYRDAGMHLVLPGTLGTLGRYFIRVRSLGSTPTSLNGTSSGQYHMQIRLQQVDEYPGSTVQYADIRYANRGIDVSGLPARSHILGEAGEVTGAANNTFAQAQPLQSLLESDLAAISISGNLGEELGVNNRDLDVDWYRFDATQTGVQVIGGVNDAAGTMAVVFDMDYADKANRADTTLAVYDESGQLIFVGRESNIEDDQPDTIDSDPDIDDLSRGSLGTKDPYIGPVHLVTGGQYYIAVMGNGVTPSALMGQYDNLGTFDANGAFQPGATADNRYVRLEPVNSVDRVVEDRIGFSGYNTIPLDPFFPNGLPIQPQSSIFNIDSSANLQPHLPAFSLENVPLYIATERPVANADDQLYLADPFNGGTYTRPVSQNSWSPANDDIQDITIRSDGRMFGYQRADNLGNSVGRLVEIDPATGTLTAVSDDNIPGEAPPINASDLNVNLTTNANRGTVNDPRLAEFTNSSDVDALAFERTGAATATPTYDVYYVVRESENSSKLYRGNEGGSAAPVAANGGNPNQAANRKYGVMGNINLAGVTPQVDTFSISNNANPAARTDIRFQSNQPGLAGAFTLNIVNAGNDTAAVVTNANINTRSITLRLGNNNGGGPNANAIVNAINTHPVARQIVTAAIYGGNANGNRDGNGGTVANNRSTPFSTPASGVALAGRVTGIAFDDPIAQQNLFGVTNAGEIILIDENSGIAQILNVVPGAEFSALALGPQSVENGAYADLMFATTTGGQLYAFNSAGVLQNIFADNSGNPTALFAQLNDIAPARGDAPVGLAFSPLDFNLWHPTTRRAGDVGHGINEAPDGSREPGQIDVEYLDSLTPDGTRNFRQNNGGASFYFGLEDWIPNNQFNNTTQGYITYDGVNAQYGLSEELHRDLASNPNLVNTYALAGGAQGQLVSNSFDLAGSVAEDRPTLYVNYFLETENHPGETTANGQDPFRDAARVFVLRPSTGEWELVATNNSALSANDPSQNPDGELPGFISHLSDAGLNSTTQRAENHQIVQELFDNTGSWRQARIDLSSFAGETGLQLRFDFSTAGRIVGDGIPSAFGEISSNSRSNATQNNFFEGFYIDDIIVGYAERGEMVTVPAQIPSVEGALQGGTRAINIDSGTFTLLNDPRYSNRDPNRNPEILSGPYQVEIRRVDEYASLADANIIPDFDGTFQPFDTNVRHILSEDGVTMFGGTTGLLADQNRERQQGMFIIDSNFISDSNDVGINVQPGTAEETGVPHQGSLINFPQLNSPRLVPGVVIQNNVVSGDSAIRFAGETSTEAGRSVPFGRIVNNTLVGFGDGLGIDVVGQAAPTIINNILSEFGTAIDVEGFNAVNTVVRKNYFQGNASNGTTGTNPELAGPNAPLFIDRSTRNYYLESGSAAIDNSQETLPDRLAYVTFKTELGIARSNIDAPQRDVFGQLRVDSGQSGGGSGADPFIDQGAIDRADTDAPYAVLLKPIDDDNAGLDKDPNPTVVSLDDPILDVFSILIGDGRDENSPFEGTGINPATVDRDSILVRRNNIELVEGVDYRLGFNDSTGELRLTPLTTLWQPSGVYEIFLDNQRIADRAGNFLRPNQQNGETRFTIILPTVNLDYGDAIDGFGTTLGSNGARHAIIDDGFIRLGSIIDAERDAATAGSPNAADDDRLPVVITTSSLAFAAPVDNAGVSTMEVVQMPMLGDTLTIDIGSPRGPVTFEFVTVGRSAEPGNVSVIFDDSVLTDAVEIMNQLNGFTADVHNAIASVFEDFGQAFDVEFSLGDTLVPMQPSLSLTNFDDEDGVGIGSPNTQRVITATPSNPSSLVVAASPANPATIEVQSLPSNGDQIVIDLGTLAGSKTFEFLQIDPLATEPQSSTSGTIAVRYEASDSIDDIAARLAARIDQTLAGYGTSLLVSFAGNLVSLENQTTSQTVFVDSLIDPNIGSIGVLGYLNPNNSNGASILINAPNGGFLDAWIDWDQNQLFDPRDSSEDGGEQIFRSVPLSAGDNILNIVTPTTASSGMAWARFRISPEGGLASDGLAVGGEVEDYQVEIIPAPIPTPQDDLYQLLEDQSLLTAEMGLSSVLFGPTAAADDLLTPFAPTTVVLVDGPEHAENFSIDPLTGYFQYVPKADFAGIDTFTYRLADQATLLANPVFDVNGNPIGVATVSINVQPVNDVPSVENLTLLALEDTTRTFTAEQLKASAFGDGNREFTLTLPDGSTQSAPWDESIQTFNVISLQTTVAGVVTDIDWTTPIPAAGFKTPRGRIIPTWEAATGFLETIEYLADTDLNQDNANGNSLLRDEFQFTIEDDGVLVNPGADLVDPTDDTLFTGAKLTAQATAEIDVKPKNDAPIAADDVISEKNPIWNAFFIGPDPMNPIASVPVPTEDQTLVIPQAYLIANDKEARDSAADENDNTNDDGLTVTAVSATSALGGTVSIDTNGDIVYTPALNTYGEDSFTYTVTDSGITFDLGPEGTPGSMLEEPDFLTHTATVRILIKPVNDTPQADDLALDLLEYQEDEDGTGDANPVSKSDGSGFKDFSKNDLLRLGGAGSALEVTPPADFPADFDEDAQDLRVIKIGLPDATAASVDARLLTYDAVTGLAPVQTLATARGTLSLTFSLVPDPANPGSFLADSGEFVSGSYEPNVDYNEESPFDATDLFTYFVEDFSEIPVPGAGNFPGESLDSVGHGSLTSAAATVTVTTHATNDTPEFPVFDTVTFAEDINDAGDAFNTVFYDIYGEAVIASADPAVHNLPQAIFVSRDTAEDERGNNSGAAPTQSLTYSYNTLYEPAGMFESAPVLDEYGVLTLTPRADAYGYALYEVTMTDNGQTYDPATGMLVDDFRSVTRTLTVHITPVNDAPVTEDRALEVMEVEEFSSPDDMPTGAVASIDLTPDQFLGGTTENPELAEQSDFTDDVDAVDEFDEEEQSLRVVKFTVTLANGSTADVDAENNNGVELTLATGRITFNFDDIADGGAYTGGTYFPNVDYNEESPFAPNEQFTYVVEDFGVTTIPGSMDVTGTTEQVDYTNDGGSPPQGLNNRSTPRTMTLTTRAQNDVPEFPVFGEVTFAEDINDAGDAFNTVFYDIYGEAVIASADPAVHNLPQAIHVSRVTAEDERGNDSGALPTQSLSFSFTTLYEPAGMFETTPTLDEYGVLTLTPRADAYGYAVFVVTLTDDGGSYNLPNDPRSIDRTLTVHITPVNDAPVTVDRALEVDEVEEFASPDDSPTGDVASIDLTPEQFLGGSTENPEFAEQSDFTDDIDAVDEFDEEEQSLRVVEFTVTLADGSTAIVDAENNNGVELTLATGRITFNFDDIADGGAYTGGVYYPNVDYNEESPFAPNEQFTYVVEDFGTTSIPGSQFINGGAADEVDYTNDGAMPPVGLNNRSTPRTMTLTTRAQNDAPEFPVFNTVTFAEDINDAGDTFNTVIYDIYGESIIASADPAVHNLPQAIFVSRETAEDERGNAGGAPATQSLTYTYNPLYVPAGMFESDPVLDEYGVLTLTPRADAYGYAVYTVTMTDDGQSYDPNTGMLVDDFRSITRTLTVHITPVNDAPVTVDRALEAVEAEEFANETGLPTGDVASINLTPEQFLGGSAENSELAEQSDFTDDLDAVDEFDEEEQSLRVVEFTVTLADGSTVVVDAENNNGVELTLATGRVTFNFDDISIGGAYTGGVYYPNVDYNEEAPFAANEQFTYVVEDFGTTSIPGSQFVNSGAADEVDYTNDGAMPPVGLNNRSTPRTMTLTTRAKNDAPEFPVFDTVTFAEDINDTGDSFNTVFYDVYAGNVVANYDPADPMRPQAIFVSRDTAFDERGDGLGFDPTQSLSYTFTSLASSSPAGMFETLPTMDDFGVLTLTPRADVYGWAVFEVTATDDGSDYDAAAGLISSPRSITRTLTINITPVNDAPVSVDRDLEVTEVEEFSSPNDLPTGAVARLPLSPADFLGGTPENPTLAKASDFSDDTVTFEEFDEDEQGLRVVEFTVTLANGSPQTVNAGNYVNGTPIDLFSGTIWFEFDATTGEFVTGEYLPNVDVNDQLPFEPTEVFQYIVEDFGPTSIPGSDRPEPDAIGSIDYTTVGGVGSNNRSQPRDMTLTVRAVNDVPDFPEFDTVTFAEDINDAGGAFNTVFYDIYGGQVIGSNNPLVHGLPQAIHPGRDTALDERSVQELSYSVSVISSPAGMFASDPILDRFGVLQLQPNADAYGYAVFALTMTDDGQSYISGSMQDDPRSITRTLTVNITPVNDQPVAYDRELTVNEVEEFFPITGQPTGRVAVLDLTPETFLEGNPSDAQTADFADGVVTTNEFDEDEQDLRVVQFTVTNSSGTPTVVSRDNLNGVEIPLATGTVTFNFDASGAFVSGQYLPSVDYNQEDPFLDFERFSYIVEDFGETSIPGSDYVNGQMAPPVAGFQQADYTTVGGVGSNNRSESRRVTIRTIQVNDAPRVEFRETVDIRERDDNRGTSLTDWATRRDPAETTALDEFDRQDVFFTFKQYVSQSVPDLFRPGFTPEVSDDGTLTVYPSPDAVGTGVFVITATDRVSDTDPFTPKSTEMTVTVNVRPVNDQPRLSDIAPTGQTGSIDDAYEITSDGTLIVTMKEDNTANDGTTGTPYSIPLRSVGPGARPGLLDIYTPGPANESDGTLGGNQKVELVPFTTLPTTLGGSVTYVPENGSTPASLEYTPPTNANSLNNLPDSFTYQVIDDGTNFNIRDQVLDTSPLTRTGRIQFVLNPVNDRPVFDIAQTVINVSEDANMFVRNDFAFNVFGGPTPTANDEFSLTAAQTVSFNRIEPVNVSTTQAAQAFTTLPTIVPAGHLTFQAAPGVFGEFVFDIYGQDNGQGPNFGRGDLNESLAQRITINVLAVNDAPIPANGTGDTVTIATREDNTLAIPVDGVINGSLLGNFIAGPDSPVDGLPDENESQTLSAVNVPLQTAMGGTLTPSPNGAGATSYVYTPPLNFVGTDQFVYEVSDGDASRTTSATISLVVTPVNDAPIISPLAPIVVEESAGTVTLPDWLGTVLVGPPGTGSGGRAVDEFDGTGTTAPQTITEYRFSYVSGDTDLLATSAGNPAGLQILSDGSLQFTTSDENSGSATYQLVAVDSGPNNPANGDVWESAPVQFTLTIADVNDLPTFTAGPAVTVLEDSGTYSQPWATDISAGPGNEGNQTVAFLVQVPAEDQDLFSVLPSIDENGVLTFSVAPDAAGSTDVTVTLQDFENGVFAGSSQPVTLSITITDQPDLPVAVDDSFTTTEDAVLFFTIEDLLANDSDPDLSDILSFVELQTTTALGAIVNVNQTTGEISYTPMGSDTIQSLRPGETATDTFQYGLQDDSGVTSVVTANVTLTIQGRNDAPVAVDDRVFIESVGTTVLDQMRDPLFNDSDIDGTLDRTSLTIVVEPQFGTLSDDNGVLTYLPGPDFAGVDTFTYTIADDLGQASAQATVELQGRPTASDITAGTSVGRTGAIDISDSFNTAFDLDLTSILITTQPTNGTAEVIDGKIMYTPDTDYVGPDFLIFTVADINGNRSAPTRMNLNTVMSRLQNPVNFSDVNRNGEVTALDALLIINRLNEVSGSSSGENIPVTDADFGIGTNNGVNEQFYYDQSGDGFISSLDALRVINEINAQSQSGFGEPTDVLASDFSTSAGLDASTSSAAESVDSGPSKMVGSSATNAEVDLIDLIANEQTKRDGEESDSLESNLDTAVRELF